MDGRRRASWTLNLFQRPRHCFAAIAAALNAALIKSGARPQPSDPLLAHAAHLTIKRALRSALGLCISVPTAVAGRRAPAVAVPPGACALAVAAVRAHSHRVPQQGESAP